jgi:uncharacterized DUF497 family protein
MELHFEWDQTKADSNLRKHGVSFVEASEVFSDPLAITLFDEENSEQEERWITLGQVQGRKLVVAVHTWIEGDGIIHIRMISARLATAHEAKNYEG